MDVTSIFLFYLTLSLTRIDYRICSSITLSLSTMLHTFCFPKKYFPPYTNLQLQETLADHWVRLLMLLQHPCIQLTRIELDFPTGTAGPLPCALMVDGGPWSGTGSGGCELLHRRSEVAVRFSILP